MHELMDGLNTDKFATFWMLPRENDLFSLETSMKHVNQ